MSYREESALNLADVCANDPGVSEDLPRRSPATSYILELAPVETQGIRRDEPANEGGSDDSRGSDPQCPTCGDGAEPPSA